MSRVLLLLALLLPFGAAAQPKAPPPCYIAGGTCPPGPVTDQLTKNGVTPADQLPAIDQRAPAQTDDSSHDYANPYAWWAQKTAAGVRVFQQLLNNTNNPQWTNQNLQLNPLPCDAASVAPALCLWLQQAKSSYTGPILRAQFSDGTTLDVQQLANGKPDQATLWQQAKAHANAGAVAAIGTQTARLNTWYDQSGNGYNCTQATAANQALITVDRNGNLAIVWDEFTTAGTTTTYIRTCAISSSLSLTQDTTSVLTINATRALEAKTNTNNGIVSLFQLGAAGGAHALQLGNFYNAGVVLYGDGSAGTFGGWHSNLPSLSWLTTSASSRTYAVDGFTPFTKSGDVGANTILGGVLGMTTGASQGAGPSVLETTQYGVTAFASTLSAADLLSAQIAHHATGLTTPQARCNVVLTGESVMAGFAASGAQSWAQQLQDMLSSSVRVFNFGWESQGIGTTTPSNLTIYAASTSQPFNSTDRCNILIVNGGNTNDYGWAGSGTPSVTAVQEQGYINQLTADPSYGGGQAWSKIFVMTEIDRTGGGANFYTLMAAMNASIISGTNTSAGNYTPIRVDLDPELGTLNSSSGNAACFPDGIHLSALCSANVATIIKNAIAPYIRPGG